MSNINIIRGNAAASLSVAVSLKWIMMFTSTHAVPAAAADTLCAILRP